MTAASRSAAGMDTEDEERYAVLLFYQYCELPLSVCEEMREGQMSLCKELDLKGRVRIAREGLNVTLGGTQRAVKGYIASLKTDAIYAPLNPESIHFKIGFLVENSPIAHERQKLTTLSVKLTKEVVSLDVSEELRQLVLAAGPGQHLSPEEFHSTLILAEQQHGGRDNIALIDVRNSYETRIGRFEGALDPHTRQFSDFARWADSNLEHLRSKREVLMYCTGGVRCERASAYLRARGVARVSQLYGGIQNYQESFPEGGLFHGKNFVYDNRVAVPCRRKEEVVGRCGGCSQPWDDYSSQRRCELCRVLLLVCPACADEKPLRCEGC